MPATKQKTSATKRLSPAEAREANRRRIVEAAAELVRDHSFSELTVGVVMERAGLERTIFYRHFDDLFELLRTTGRAAIEELYEAQVALGEARPDYGPEGVRPAAEQAVQVYARHGPVLRAVAEAAAADRTRREMQEPLRRRFDELIAGTLRGIETQTGREFADVMETARAMNLLADAYLLDAFGWEPRISAERATETLSEIWLGLTR
jgi:AcrR family transcriptional regulator